MIYSKLEVSLHSGNRETSTYLCILNYSSNKVLCLLRIKTRTILFPPAFGKGGNNHNFLPFSHGQTLERVCRPLDNFFFVCLAWFIFFLVSLKRNFRKEPRRKWVTDLYAARRPWHCGSEEGHSFLHLEILFVVLIAGREEFIAKDCVGFSYWWGSLKIGLIVNGLEDFRGIKTLGNLGNEQGHHWMSVRCSFVCKVKA